MPSDATTTPETGDEAYGFAQFIEDYRGGKTVGHYGWLWGHSSFIYRLPELGCGLAILINDQEYGRQVCEIVRNTIFDFWMENTPEIDWEKQIILRTFKARDFHTILCSDNALTEDSNFDWIPGRYESKGHCLLEVIEVDFGRGRRDIADTSRGGPGEELEILQKTASQLCEALPKLGFPVNTASPLYVAKGRNWSSSHYIFSHIDGSLYHTYRLEVASEPLAEPIAFTSWGCPPAKAYFTPTGIAMHGNFWLKGDMVEDSLFDPADPEGSCEVWFGRVE